MAPVLPALALLPIAACSGKPYIVQPQSQTDTIRSHRVYIVSHGWHVGFVVPGGAVNQVLPAIEARFGDVAFYELGWGDKGFYQSQEITIGLTLQAVFWSEGAVIHVVAVPDSPITYFAGEDAIDTCLSDHELSSLQTFLAKSFARDSTDHVVPLNPRRQSVLRRRRPVLFIEHLQ